MLEKSMPLRVGSFSVDPIPPWASGFSAIKLGGRLFQMVGKQ